MRCLCGINQHILDFALPPLCLVCMNFLMLSAIKLGCMSCVEQSVDHIACVMNSEKFIMDKEN